MSRLANLAARPGQQALRKSPRKSKAKARARTYHTLGAHTPKDTMQVLPFLKQQQKKNKSKAGRPSPSLNVHAKVFHSTKEPNIQDTVPLEVWPRVDQLKYPFLSFLTLSECLPHFPITRTLEEMGSMPSLSTSSSVKDSSEDDCSEHGSIEYESSVELDFLNFVPRHDSAVILNPVVAALLQWLCQGTANSDFLGPRALKQEQEAADMAAKGKPPTTRLSSSTTSGGPALEHLSTLKYDLAMLRVGARPVTTQKPMKQHQAPRSTFTTTSASDVSTHTHSIAPTPTPQNFVGWVGRERKLYDTARATAGSAARIPAIGSAWWKTNTYSSVCSITLTN